VIGRIWRTQQERLCAFGKAFELKSNREVNWTN